MAESDFWAIGAIAFALIAGILLGRIGMDAWTRKKFSASMFGANGPGSRNPGAVSATGRAIPARHAVRDSSRASGAGSGAVVQRHGLERLLERNVPFLMPMAERLLEISAFSSGCSQAMMMLGEFGVKTTPANLLSILLGVSFCAGIACFILSGSPVFGLAIVAVVVLAANVFVTSRCEKRNSDMREAIPEALRCMETCYRSGQSMVQTMRHTSSEVEGSLGKIFGVVADRLEMGESTKDALAAMRSNANVPELSFVAVALDIQHQSGGRIGPVLESARDAIKSELELLRTMKVQTAQAKLSATIVTLMPFVLVGLFSLLSPGFLSAFFESFIGMVLLGVALGMQITGVVVVRRMLKIDVD